MLTKTNIHTIVPILHSYCNAAAVVQKIGISVIRISRVLSKTAFIQSACRKCKAALALDELFCHVVISNSTFNLIHFTE